MGFQVWRGVAADHAGGARVQPEFFHQHPRDVGGLVGDDPPAQAALFERREQVRQSREQAGVYADLVRVVLEKRVAKTLVFRMLGQDTEPGANQSARASSPSDLTSIQVRLVDLLVTMPQRRPRASISPSRASIPGNRRVSTQISSA